MNNFSHRMKAAFSGQFDRQRLSVVDAAIKALERKIERSPIEFPDEKIADIIDLKTFRF